MTSLYVPSAQALQLVPLDPVYPAKHAHCWMDWLASGEYANAGHEEQAL